MTKKLLRFSGFCILACLTIYLSSCKTTEIILHGHLTGTVSDNENNDPVQGAFVELVSEDQSTLTDSLGNYELRNIDPDDHYVEASAEGYRTDENFVIIREAQVNIQDFSLVRSGIAIFSIDSLEFGFESDTLIFNLSNTGKEQMNYSFVPSQQWISIDPVSGFLDVSDSVAVTVSIDRTGLDNSTKEEFIQISALNENDELDLYVNRVMDMDTNFYKVVEIYDQIWMAENLNVGTRIDMNPPYTEEEIDELVLEMHDNDIIEKCCYENSEYNCSQYGGLYMWWEAMQWWEGVDEPGPTGPIQGICPDGWHIPTMDDRDRLIENLGGHPNAAYELTKGSANCTNPDPDPNESGFSALFGGWLENIEDWYDMGKATFFWTSHKRADVQCAVLFIGCSLNGGESDLFSINNARGFAAGVSVRCIKDP